MKKIIKLLSSLLTVIMLMAAAPAAFAAVNDTGFSDVSADAWYAEAVQYVRDNGVMSGTTATTFSPDETATRAMLVSILYRVAGSPAVTGTDTFSDTAADAYYSDAVVWASTKGIASGYGNGLFGTNDRVSSQQIATILCNYMKMSKDGNQTPDKSGNTLVVYFSATGSTEAVAKTIAETADADLFELVPTEPYTSDNLNWTEDGSRVNVEHDNPSRRTVELVAATVDNWASYDTVFIGYPIWWGIAAWPVDSFITSNDFSGKTVIPFATSTSSGLGQSGQLLEEAAGTGSWMEGRRFSGGAAAAEVQEWADGFSQ